MLKGKIELKEMEFYAFHGHFKSEQTIGNKFIVNVILETDCKNAVETDNLKQALNYQTVYDLISKEMKIKSYLLEHLAGRILDQIFNQFPKLLKAKVTVTKINPPLGGKIKEVNVTLKRKNIKI